jgi:hypothetical protein
VAEEALLESKPLEIDIDESAAGEDPVAESLVWKFVFFREYFVFEVCTIKY